MNRKNLVDVEKLLEYGKYILAALVAFIHAIPELTWFLIWLMVFDSVFGLMVSIKQRYIDPDKASKAATKKAGKLLVVVLMAVVRQYVDIGIDFVQIVTVLYIGPEILYIIRKLIVLEVPVPPQLEQVAALFQDKSKDANNTVP